MPPVGTLQRGSNVIAFALVLVVNGIAGATTLIGGRTTADVSNEFPTLLTPAGYVFAIWGVIYVLLAIFVIYQALPANIDGQFHKRIGWMFVISSALNILWIFAWQYEYLSLSVLIILAYLASLILIYLRLGIGRRRVDRAERLAVHLPFSVYLGWLTIATVADVSVTLVSLNWDGFGIGSDIWAILVGVLILIIAVLVAVTRRDIAYELVIIWAFAGIAVNQSSNQTIVALMAIAIAAVIVATVASMLIKRKARVGVTN